MIAVDAMGGDFAPKVVVQGAYNAVMNTSSKVSITLFGHQEVIEQVLGECDKYWRALPIKIVDCRTVVGMGDEPTKDLLRKKDSSLFSAIQAVAEQKAQAVVSAGNSGAALVAGIMVLGRVPGLARPALGTFLPTKKDPVFVIDVGANTDCKAEYLRQFALMGTLFVQQTTACSEPRVALLSNGEEPYKGSQAVKQAYELLENSMSLNFIGNLEAREIFNGAADVLVCDGFVGNILLKSVQGTAQALFDWMKQAYGCSWYGKLLGLLSKNLMKPLKEKIDYREQGGALLLGLNHPLIVAHGCSNAKAIENAILFAHSVVQKQTIKKFNALLSEQLVKQSITITAVRDLDLSFEMSSS